MRTGNDKQGISRRSFLIGVGTGVEGTHLTTKLNPLNDVIPTEIKEFDEKKS